MPSFGLVFTSRRHWRWLIRCRLRHLRRRHYDGHERERPRSQLTKTLRCALSKPAGDRHKASGLRVTQLRLFEIAYSNHHIVSARSAGRFLDAGDGPNERPREDEHLLAPWFDRRLHE